MQHRSRHAQARPGPGCGAAVVFRSCAAFALAQAQWEPTVSILHMHPPSSRQEHPGPLSSIFRSTTGLLELEHLLSPHEQPLSEFGCRDSQSAVGFLEISVETSCDLLCNPQQPSLVMLIFKCGNLGHRGRVFA